MAGNNDFPCCVVCLFKKGKTKPALTAVKGYPVCKKHLSYKEDFFRDWEAVQDPRAQANPAVVKAATDDTAGGTG